MPQSSLFWGREKSIRVEPNRNDLQPRNVLPPLSRRHRVRQKYSWPLTNFRPFLIAQLFLAWLFTLILLVFLGLFPHNT